MAAVFGHKQVHRAPPTRCTRIQKARFSETTARTGDGRAGTRVDYCQEILLGHVRTSPLGMVKIAIPQRVKNVQEVRKLVLHKALGWIFTCLDELVSFLILTNRTFKASSKLLIPGWPEEPKLP